MTSCPCPGGGKGLGAKRSPSRDCKCFCPSFCTPLVLVKIGNLLTQQGRALPVKAGHLTHHRAGCGRPKNARLVEILLFPTENLTSPLMRNQGEKIASSCFIWLDFQGKKIVAPQKKLFRLEMVFPVQEVVFLPSLVFFFSEKNKISLSNEPLFWHIPAVQCRQMPCTGLGGHLCCRR